MKKTLILLLLTFSLSFPSLVLAGPVSTNFELVEYGFGSGGVSSASSANYSMFGTVGEVESSRSASANYKSGNGLIFTMLANVPPAPTFTNPGSNYDRLKFIINTGDNPADTTYAIAISTDNFASDTRYIKADNTIGTILTPSDYQTYANWGGGTGELVTDLTQDTTYYIKVKARQGDFTETGYGPVSSASTSEPSLTFGVSADTVTFSNLNQANSYTDASKTTILTTSTNAYNGYVVNARSTGDLTFNTNTIANYTSPNSAPTTWSGSGFGYTTDDNDVTGGTADRFTNGGPKYAGFTQSSPGDPVADHAGPILSPISNEQFTLSYKVAASSSTVAGKYQTTIMYIVVPTY